MNERTITENRNFMQLIQLSHFLSIQSLIVFDWFCWLKNKFVANNN